jgi:hypothetical protein
MDKVKEVKPLVSLWNTNDTDLSLNASWTDVRDLSVQVLTIT